MRGRKDGSVVWRVQPHRGLSLAALPARKVCTLQFSHRDVLATGAPPLCFCTQFMHHGIVSTSHLHFSHSNAQQQQERRNGSVHLHSSTIPQQQCRRKLHYISCSQRRSFVHTNVSMYMRSMKGNGKQVSPSLHPTLIRLDRATPALRNALPRL